jgi:hypothetical protein
MFHSSIILNICSSFEFHPQSGPYFPIGTLGTCLGRKDFRGGKILKLTLHILSSTRLNKKSYFNDETISNIIVDLPDHFSTLMFDSGKTD